MSSPYDKLTEDQIAEAVYRALSTEDGKVLYALLKSHCSMDPKETPPSWRSSEQVEFRYGRITLFQTIQFFQEKGRELAYEPF